MTHFTTPGQDKVDFRLIWEDPGTPGVDFPGRRLDTLSHLAYAYYRASAGTTVASHFHPPLKLYWYNDGNTPTNPQDDTYGLLIYEEVYQDWGTFTPIPEDVWVQRTIDLSQADFWMYCMDCDPGPGTTSGAVQNYNTSLPEWLSGPVTGLPGDPTPPDLSQGQTYVLGVEVGVGSGWNGDVRMFVDGLRIAFGPTDDVLYNFEPVALQGRVYEDPDGDGNLGDGIGRPNVQVLLFRDDGDGQPDAGDPLHAQTTTGSDGSFALGAAPDATYWLVVDSKTIAPHAGFNPGYDQGDVWAEQTYGPAGAYCANPDGLLGAGNPYVRTSAGPCMGGRRGSTSDDATTLESAEHIAKVEVSGADVSGLDFGFSFNVVTNVNDWDDDPAADRTCQGCLRQFVQNANAIARANAMRFVPTVSTNAGGSGGAWWRADLQLGGLPVILDHDTTVDGTAYEYDDGTTVRDTNPGQVGSGGTVGTRGTALSKFDKLELEIDFNDANRGIVVGDTTTQPSRVTLRRLALVNTNAIGIDIQGGSANFLVEANLVGLHADGSPPAPSALLGRDCIRIRDATLPPSAAEKGTVRHNAIGYCGATGVALGSSTTSGADALYTQVIGNEIFACGQNPAISTADAISVYADHVLLRGNLIRNTLMGGGTNPRVAGKGVEFRYNADDAVIEDNTIYSNASAGILLEDDSDQATIRFNVIYQNGGPGVAVGRRAGSAIYNRVSQNHIYDNQGPGIDLNDDPGNTSIGDGVSGNDGATSSGRPNYGVDYPVLTAAGLSGTDLHLEGYIGSNRAGQWLSGTFTLEIFKADNDPADQDGEVEAGDGQRVPHGEGAEYLGSCTVTLGTRGTFTCTITGVSSLNPGDAITATATDADGNTSEFGPNLVLRGVQGTVFEDITGDALADGDTNIHDNAGDQRAASGVTVKIYRDDGDGQPDSDDNAYLVGTTTTAADGTFAFTVADGATYWLVVDSRSIAPNAGFNTGYDQGDVWAEQTYGPAGAYCANPDGLLGAGNPYVRTSAGPCFGGSDISYGGESDNPATITHAEHIAKVEVSGADVSGLDFGFSFNVVTNVNDRDDDPAADRTCQGCLRQFVQNANAIAGANAMRFVPTVSRDAGKNYWTLQASRAMTSSDPFSTGRGPVFHVTDAYTRVDGRAYAYHQPDQARNTNGIVRSGFTAGYLQTCSVEAFDGPELEIFVPRRHAEDRGEFDDETSLWRIDNRGDDATIFYADGNAEHFTLRYIAAYGGHYVVFVDDVEHALLEHNFLGISASGLADPDPGGRCPGLNCPRSNRGVVVNHVQYVELRHNLIGYTRLHGVFFYRVNGSYTPADVVTTGTALIENNEVAYSSQAWWHQNGIGLEGGSSRVVVRCNYVHHSQAVGIETWGSNGYHWIGQNTVEHNGLGNTEFGAGSGPGYDAKRERIGIRLKAPANTVKYNKVDQNQGVGVLVVDGHHRNRISKNAIYDNHAGDDPSRSWLGLELIDSDLSGQVTINLGDGVLANDGVWMDTDANRGVDYPIFTAAVLVGNDLHLWGYIGSNRASQWLSGTFTIEVFKADNDPADQDGEVEAGDGQRVPHGEGAEYLGSCTVTLGTNGAFACTITGVSGLSLGDEITATATDADGNTSEFGPNIAATSDRGDAPAGYGDPAHGVVGGLYLGAAPPDSENPALHGPNADGDDRTGTDDEDGVSTLPPLHQGMTSYSLDVQVTNNTGRDATLVGWVDFDRDGTFEPAEAASRTVPDGTASTVTLTWSGLSGLVVGDTYLRLRLSTDPNLNASAPTGAMRDGEVEDYALTIQAAADLSISKTDSPDPVTAGSTLTYTLTVTNHGPSDASGVTVTDTLPADVTYQSDTCGGAVSGATWTWNVGSLANGAHASCQVTVQVSSSATGTLTNTATVRAATPDGDTTNNTTTEDTAVAQSADLSLTKRVTPTTAEPGDTVTFTLTLRNDGPSDATQVQVEDRLPNGYTYVVGSIGGDPGSTGAVITPDESAAPTLRWTVDRLNPGESVVLTFQATVRAGEHLNVAEVSAADQPDPDSTPGNHDPSEDDYATAQVTTLFDPPESWKTVDDDGWPLLVWRMVWVNNGNATALRVQISDPVPANTRYVPGSLTCTGQGATVVHVCTYNAGTGRIEVEADIAPDPGVTDPHDAAHALVISFQTEVEGAPAYVENQGLAYWDENGDGTVGSGDANVDHDTPARTDDPTTPEPDDPTRAYPPPLPKTGFAPGRVTHVPAAPARLPYQDLGPVWVEIPRLDVRAPVMGVEPTADLTWLADVAWMTNTAFPGRPGNSVLTAHNWLPSGLPGPFAQIHTLRWGDIIRVHVYGAVYEYQVREVRYVTPQATWPLEPVDDGYAWLTLLTCGQYDEGTGGFKNHVVVRAVLVEKK